MASIPELLKQGQDEMATEANESRQRTEARAQEHVGKLLALRQLVRQELGEDLYAVADVADETGKVKPYLGESDFVVGIKPFGSDGPSIGIRFMWALEEQIDEGNATPPAQGRWKIAKFSPRMPERYVVSANYVPKYDGDDDAYHPEPTALRPTSSLAKAVAMADEEARGSLARAKREIAEYYQRNGVVKPPGASLQPTVTAATLSGPKGATFEA